MICGGILSTYDICMYISIYHIYKHMRKYIYNTIIYNCFCAVWKRSPNFFWELVCLNFNCIRLLYPAGNWKLCSHFRPTINVRIVYNFIIVIKAQQNNFIISNIFRLKLFCIFNKNFAIIFFMEKSLKQQQFIMLLWNIPNSWNFNFMPN